LAFRDLVELARGGTGCLDLCCSEHDLDVRRKERSACQGL
jgi:hypothetical protein